GGIPGKAFPGCMSEQSNHRPYAFMALALVVVTMAAYWPVRGFEFNNFDDPDYVAQNETVQRGLTAEGVRWAFTTNFMGNWHPLTWLSHMVDCELFGVNPGAHHFMSAIIHALNTVLLLWVLYRLTGKLERGAFVAALFALHPLHVESVAWVAERKDVLSGFFWLLTMWAYVRYVEARSAWRYIVMLLAFACGLLSKPMVVTLPCVLLLLDFWPLRRAKDWRDALKLVLEKLPLFALTAASCVVTFVVQKQGGAVGSFEKFPLLARVGNAFVAYAAYLGKTILPEGLAPFYPHPGAWPSWQVAGSVVLLVGVTVFAIAIARKAPYVTVGWLWFVGTLVPVIGIVQVGDQAYADRYTYVPLIGLSIAVVWAVGDLALRARWPVMGVRLGGIALLLIYAAMATVQVRYWRNSETLFRHTLRVTEKNYVANYNLGQALSVQNRIHEAVPFYHATLEIKPGHEGAHNNLGLTLALQGQWEQATNHYAAALRTDPKNADVHCNMGIAQVRLGDISNAIHHLELTVNLRPQHALAHRYLADALGAAGRVGEAMQHYRQTLKIDPKQFEAANNLAWQLATSPDASLRDGKEAVRLAEIACELTEYRVPQMLGTLAAACAEAGDFTRAVEYARKAELLATQQHNAQLAERNRQLRQKYEAQQPHREG
ncbi:MAG: tetratricopeptide repeat protein, partial [Verrucomicrobia subdivision 3 bacterium]|nr:tetratricopeptide repeat protein [Limisphaerales bacterium]